MLPMLSSQMKRKRVDLEQVAELNNLNLAFHKAARGKRHRDTVQTFLQHYDANINKLSQDILSEKLPYGQFRSFEIHDPKKRLIHAACFEDRIFHHALMNIIGEFLERRMQHSSFACRKDKGVHRAAVSVQQNLRKYPWYVKIDIDGYFPSIGHQQLLVLLTCCFKGTAGISQLERVVNSYSAQDGYGLPIGSLTSQYFANYYLDGLDCWLSDHPKTLAYVRYMDDVIWWCGSKADARSTLKLVRSWLQCERGLVVKPSVQIQKSSRGVSYCGFQILLGAIRLSRRRKRRYHQRRVHWEQEYMKGNINAIQLQQAYAAVHAITEKTDSAAWRCESLRRHPPIGV